MGYIKPLYKFWQCNPNKYSEPAKVPRAGYRVLQMCRKACIHTYMRTFFRLKRNPHSTQQSKIICPIFKLNQIFDVIKCLMKYISSGCEPLAAEGNLFLLNTWSALSSVCFGTDQQLHPKVVWTDQAVEGLIVTFQESCIYCLFVSLPSL